MSEWLLIFSVNILLISSSLKNDRLQGFTTCDEAPKNNPTDTLPAKDSILKQKEAETLSGDTVIFTTAAISPSIDQKQWIQHLQKNLVSFIESAAANGMPTGTYTVMVRFVVEKDGSVTNIQALNNPGYGLKEASVKILETSPKWKPAVANGKIVRCYHTQPITYVISEG